VLSKHVIAVVVDHHANQASCSTYEIQNIITLQ